MKEPVTNLCTEVDLSTYQARVQPWLVSCFGAEIAEDQLERMDRFLEEVFELLQALGYEPSRILRIRDYTYGRDVGEPSQELGGVMVTLAALSLAFKLDMHAAGETELARVWTKVEKIRAKQAAKPKFQPEPQAFDLDARRTRAITIYRETMVENGVCQEDLERFDANPLDGDDLTAIQAIEKALAIEVPATSNASLLRLLMNAMSNNLKAQGEANGDWVQVLSDTISLDGQFDLISLAEAVSNFVKSELHALEHSNRELHILNQNLRNKVEAK